MQFVVVRIWSGAVAIDWHMLRVVDDDDDGRNNFITRNWNVDVGWRKWAVAAVGNLANKLY